MRQAMKPIELVSYHLGGMKIGSIQPVADDHTRLGLTSVSFYIEYLCMPEFNPRLEELVE